MGVIAGGKDLNSQYALPYWPSASLTGPKMSLFGGDRRYRGRHETDAISVVARPALAMARAQAAIACADIGSLPCAVPSLLPVEAIGRSRSAAGLVSGARLR